MGLACKCPTSFLYDQTREFPTIILGIFTVSKTHWENLPDYLNLFAFIYNSPCDPYEKIKSILNWIL